MSKKTATTLMLGFILLSWILVVALIFMPPLAHAAGKTKHTDEPMIGVACIIDKPYGVTRYTISSASTHGYGESLIAHCLKKFKRQGSRPTRFDETLHLLPSTQEIHVNAVYEGVACEMNKDTSLPSSIFIISSYDPKNFDDVRIMGCLRALDEKTKNAHDSAHREIIPIPFDVRPSEVVPLPPTQCIPSNKPV